jgi:hypothetical protein
MRKIDFPQDYNYGALPKEHGDKNQFIEEDKSPLETI